MIYDQKTMPLPRIRDPRPTFRQFREYSDPFDIVLLDVVLPGSISGTEIINYLCGTWPELPLIIMSALNSMDIANIQRQFPEAVVLQKPFRIQALRVAIEERCTIKA